MIFGRAMTLTAFLKSSRGTVSALKEEWGEMSEADKGYWGMVARELNKEQSAQRKNRLEGA